TIARRLEGCIGPDDTVARFGSDEFAVLFDGGGAAEIEVVARQLGVAISVPIASRGRSLVLAASIGVAAAGSCRPQPEDVMRDAESALYRAKEAGGSRCVVFDDGMRAEMLARLETEQSLRGALDRDELRVFYQPVCSLETGATIGVEALTRWEHPTRGLLPPDEFIPIAEATG